MICLGQVKVESSDNRRVSLKCNENRTHVDAAKSECTVSSTRCVLSGYEFDSRGKFTHPKESYYVSCLLFDKANVYVSKQDIFDGF